MKSEIPEFRALKKALVGIEDVVERWEDRARIEKYVIISSTAYSEDTRAASGEVQEDYDKTKEDEAHASDGEKRSSLFGRRKLISGGALFAAISVSAGKKVLDTDVVADIVGSISVEINEAMLTESEKVSYAVGIGFARRTTEREYNDTHFDNAITPADVGGNIGSAALHNSFYYTKWGFLEEIPGNLLDLRLALKNTKDHEAKAAIIQRIAVNNNMLGSGGRAAEAVDSIEWEHLKTNSRIYSRSIDLTSTMKLQALSRDELVCFAGFPAKGLCGHWEKLIGINPSSAVAHDFIHHAERFRASISSAIQAKWIAQVQIDCKKRADISRTRQQWVNEMVAVINGLEHKDFAASIGEDFHYWMCRPAFHALRCGDLIHLQHILSIFFGPKNGGVEIVKRHVVHARTVVLKKRTANTLWMILLRLVAERLQESPDQRIIDWCKDQLFPEDPSLGNGAPKIANIALARAATDVNVALGKAPFWLAATNRLSWLFNIPNIESGSAYYNLIRTASLGYKDRVEYAST